MHRVCPSVWLKLSNGIWKLVQGPCFKEHCKKAAHRHVLDWFLGLEVEGNAKYNDRWEHMENKMNITEIVLGHASSHGRFITSPSPQVNVSATRQCLRRGFCIRFGLLFAIASIHRFILCESVLRIGFAVVQMHLQTSFGALLTWVLAVVWQREAQVPA